MTSGEESMSSNPFEQLLRVIRLGYHNFWRNRWLTFGATLLMTLTLVMISASLLITYVIGDASNVIRDKISVTAYFRDDSVPDDKILALSERISAATNVESVDFVSKEEALGIFQRLPSINQDVKDPVTSEFNPLPRSLEVKTNDVEKLVELQVTIEAADTENLICADCLSLTRNQEIVDRIVSGTKAFQQAGWVLSIFFGVIALFNIYNIIRITITARSDEIEIMRYVGASNAFVRGPFIVEGILYGFFATIITTVALPLMAKIFSLTGAGKEIGGAFALLGTNMFDYVLGHMGVLIAVQISIGLVLGVLVSVLSIRRFLRA